MAYRPPKEKTGPLIRLALLPLDILSLLYGIAVRVRLLLYSAGFLKKHKVNGKVISVGNITVGGTGKTPTTEAVALGLQKRGYKVAVLSRGYKGKKREEINLVSDGETLFLGPAEAGDEPYMLARRLKGIPVVVGTDRHKIATFALERFGVQALILDDGFQHLRLHRDLNILLVDGKRGFGNGRLLPRGPLREPLAGMRRADLILVNKGDAAGSEIEKSLSRWRAGQPVYRSRYEATGLLSLWDKSEAPIERLSGAKVVTLSAIATPSSFSGLLSSLGATVLKEVAFPDHHHYREKDLADTGKSAEAAGADCIITTEKDAVKLEKFPPMKGTAVYFLQIALVIEGGEAAFINSVIKQSGLDNREIQN